MNPQTEMGAAKRGGIRKSIVGAAAAVVLMATGGSAAAANWGKFQKQCVGDGVAKYSAVLQGIPPGQSWERACAASAATINGQRHARPTNCVNRRTAMWGEFVVPDRSCARPKEQLRWGSFKDNGCVTIDGRGIGMRSYSSVLWGIPPGQSWEATCARTGATVAGHQFSHPTACVKADLKEVAEVTRTVAKAIGKVAKSTKHPKLYIAAKTTALIATIAGKVNPALNIWGVFYVEDRQCPEAGMGRQ
jgi:hypothetical protein